jgi:hypothetical protein
MLDADILRAAREMIENHGRKAAAVAEARAANLVASQRLEVAATWRQVAAAIRRLQAERDAASG